MSGLNELNSRLAAIGIGVQLTAHSAEALKTVASRDHILKAVARVELANDAGAFAFLQKSLERAGIVAPTRNAVPVQWRLPLQQPQAPAPVLQPSKPQRDNPAPSQPQHHSNQPAGRSKTGDWIQHHVYGKNAAIMVGLTETRKGVPTINLDSAFAVGTRQYDWSRENKVRVQVTQTELPVVAATLLGILPNCRFSNHGEKNNKGFAIDWQDDRQSFFVQIWQGKGNSRAVPMTREDAFQATQIVVRAIQAGSPARMGLTGMMAMLRSMYGRQ